MGAGLPLYKEGAGNVPSKGTKKESAGRDPATGRFVKGYGGGGRPKLPEELKEAFRAAAPEALAVLKKILMDNEAKNADRIRCAEIILDRGYGKPVQAVDIGTNAGETCGVVLLPPRANE